MCAQAYHVIKQQIITSELPLGAQISDRDIAERLRVSRTPVREAVLLLQREGFLEITPRRGLRILPLSVEDMCEVYDILTALETLAAGLAAERRPGAAELEPLTEAVRTMEAALQTQDVIAWITADERFHRTLLELSGNRRLARIGLSCRDQVQRAHLVAQRLRPLPGASVKAHARLIGLIRRGEAQKARESHYKQRVSAGAEILAVVTRCGLKSL
jgi:DNA-binding GntR family transcriptional regulator